MARQCVDCLNPAIGIKGASRTRYESKDMDWYRYWNLKYASWDNSPIDKNEFDVLDAAPAAPLVPPHPGPSVPDDPNFSRIRPGKKKNILRHKKGPPLRRLVPQEPAPSVPNPLMESAKPEASGGQPNRTGRF